MIDTELLLQIERLRNDANALILHLNMTLKNTKGQSVASLIQLEASRKDAGKSWQHIINAGELVRFGYRIK